VVASSKKPRSFARKPINQKILSKQAKIRVIKLYGRFNKEAKNLGILQWPKSTPEDPFENFGICSGHPMKELSPMLMGPVMIDGEMFSKNIEDGWQGTKVWSAHMTNGHFDSKKDAFWVTGNKKLDPAVDEWIPEWKKWSEYIRNSGLGKRRHFKIDKTQTNTNIPLFQFFQGERLSYVEGRKKMYVRWYYELVQKTNAFQYLKERYDAGTSLNLMEFDGMHRNSAEHLPEPLTPEKLQESINNPNIIFGHGMVLAAVLLGCRLWEAETTGDTETTGETEIIEKLGMREKTGKKESKEDCEEDWDEVDTEDNDD